MRKPILWDLLVIVLVFACLVSFSSGCAGSESPVPSPGPTPSPTAEPKPDEVAYTFKVEKGATDRERKQVARAQAHVNRILQSDCFERFMLDPKSKVDRNQTGGRTLKEVVEHLRKSTPTVSVHFYRDDKTTTQGFRRPSEGARVHLNRKYTDGWHSCTFTSLIIHETSHVLKYTHDKKKTPRRDYSTPYRLNSMVNKCCT